MNELDSKIDELAALKLWFETKFPTYESVCRLAYPNNKLWGVKTIRDMSIFRVDGKLGLREAKSIVDEIFQKLKVEEETKIDEKTRAVEDLLRQCDQVSTNYNIPNMDRIKELLKNSLNA